MRFPQVKQEFDDSIFDVPTGILAMPVRSVAKSLGMKVGLQLGWMGPELEKDFDGTLHRIAEIGYRDVELIGHFGRDPKGMLKSLHAAGLQCESELYFMRPD